MNDLMIKTYLKLKKKKKLLANCQKKPKRHLLPLLYSNIQDHPPLKTLVITDWPITQEARNSSTISWTRDGGRATGETAACSWAEGMEEETGWRGLLGSTPASSWSRRARWRALPECRAPPGNSRTRPRRLWSACTEWCPRWSRQTTAGPLLLTRRRNKGELVEEQQQQQQKNSTGARKKEPLAVLPRKVPMKKGHRGTLMTGEVMLMNQLGRKGVIRRKMM